MTEREAIGLAIMAGVLGGVFGAVATALFCAYRDRVLTARACRRDAIAQWLAARITLGRASLSFVAAFRSLAAERRESRYFSLRQDESQRARARWCLAAESLDLAEAKLRVGTPSPGFSKRLDGFARQSVESLRAAIDGDDVAVDRFMQAVLDVERRAIALAEAAAAEHEPLHLPAAFLKIVDDAKERVEAIINGWSSYDR